LVQGVLGWAVDNEERLVPARIAADVTLDSRALGRGPASH
jgi:hypothetical protein